MVRWQGWVTSGAFGAGGHSSITFAGVALAGIALIVAPRRLLRAIATWRAAALTPRAARVLTRLVGPLDHSMNGFLRADDAADALVGRRAAAIERLSDELRRPYARSSVWSSALRDSFSDLSFTDANRIPLPFARLVREHCAVCSVVVGSRGPQLVDLDGNWTLDVPAGRRSRYAQQDGHRRRLCSSRSCSSVSRSATAPSYRASWPAGIARQWLLFTLVVVFGRVRYLVSRLGVWSSLIWFVKLVTDPFSDLLAYVPRHLRRA